MIGAPDETRDRRPPRQANSRALAVGVATALAMSGYVTLAASDAGANHDVKAYCASIAVAASDARMAWQTTKLTELETRINGRIKELEARTADLRSWIEKRDELEKKAGEKLAGIYSKMRPETAATQIATLDDDMAAAVLAQLNPRQASAIFNEIVPERAAKLAGLIAGVGSTPEKKL